MSLLLLACTASAPESADSSPSGTDSDPIDFDDGRAGSSWTAEDVQAELLPLIELGAPNPREIGDHFLVLLAQGDEHCPGHEATLGQDNLLGCTAESGYSYAGIGWTFTEESDPETGVATWWRHGAEFEVLHPDGTRFYGAGELEVWAERTEDGFTWTSEGSGSWSDPMRGDWLGTPTSLAYLGEGRVVGAASELTLTGGFGTGGGALHFEDFGFSSMEGCDAGAHGTLRVRDPEGYWLVWELDGACSVCGTLSSAEGELGELCVEELREYGWGFLSKWRPR